MSETVLPVESNPSQTVTRALTTIFTPPASCEGRFYVEERPADLLTTLGVFSGTKDRLYRTCQPDPEAYNNYYSPGACPYNMDIAAVSSDLNNTATVTYTDICCQSGFVWDFHSCYSIVSTRMMVLIAPTVSTQDLFVPVSRLYAWHPPIMAVWETTDLSLFPSEVMRQKSSIAEYGWAAYPTSSVTSMPSESSTPSSEQNNEPKDRSLSLGAIIGIVITALVVVCLSVTLICFYRRCRQLQNKRCEPAAPLTGTRRSWLGNAWRAEMNSPATTNPVPDREATQLEHRDRQTSNRHYEKQAPIELDGGLALSPLYGPEGQGRQSIVSPVSDDHVASFNRAP
ncbi:hypothetical protein F5Y12DRAFT_518575 [Xylaria sp. FL1777]|nr:hypothetical protein F5Y12DRAFT_518575 [Xylaria sp. FL1777]